MDHSEVLCALRPYLPDSPIDISRISRGRFNDAFFVTGKEVEWVIRIAPPRDSVFTFYERDMMRQEPGIHALLLANTSVPVPKVIAYDDSLAHIDRDFIILKRLPGNPMVDVPIDENTVYRQVGAYLAQTHALTAETYGYIGDHRPMEPQSSWVDAFHFMWNRLIDGIVEVGQYSESEHTEIRRLLDQHIQLFDRNVPSSLLHMDCAADNILVDGDSKVTGLIDWERSLYGDPEIEFALLDSWGVSTPAFWEGYGKQPDRSAEAQIRQAFYLLYNTQKHIIIQQGRNNNPEGARTIKAQVFEIVANSGIG
jgi:aminoglycoside phosphotransferase (APT) family kinase protein